MYYTSFWWASVFPFVSQSYLMLNNSLIVHHNYRLYHIRSISCALNILNSENCIIQYLCGVILWCNSLDLINFQVRRIVLTYFMVIYSQTIFSPNLIDIWFQSFQFDRFFLCGHIFWFNQEHCFFLQDRSLLTTECVWRWFLFFCYSSFQLESAAKVKEFTN